MKCTRQWDDDLLDLINVPRCILPEIRSCSGSMGQHAAFLDSLMELMAMAGDLSFRFVWTSMLGLGRGKGTYGTGAFLLMNTGDEAVPSQNGLLTTVGWQIGDDVTYALEGPHSSQGRSSMVTRWAIDQTAPEGSFSESGGRHRRGLFCPVLTGLGTPYWRPDARGLITALLVARQKPISPVQHSKALRFRTTTYFMP